MPQKAGKEGSGSARILLLTHREKSAADTQPSCRHWGSGHGTTTTASCNEVTTAQPWGYLAAETQATVSLGAHFRPAWPPNQRSPVQTRVQPEPSQKRVQ